MKNGRKKKIIIAICILFIILAGVLAILLTRKDNDTIDTTPKQQQKEVVDNNKDDNKEKEVIKEDKKDDTKKEDKYYSVVFLDASGNELQRKTVKEGTIPSFTSNLPSNFSYWKDVKTGKTVSKFSPVYGNITFVAVVTSATATSSSGGSSNPTPTPTPTPTAGPTPDETCPYLYITNTGTGDGYVDMILSSFPEKAICAQLEVPIPGTGFTLAQAANYLPDTDSYVTPVKLQYSYDAVEWHDFEIREYEDRLLQGYPLEAGQTMYFRATPGETNKTFAFASAEVQISANISFCMNSFNTFRMLGDGAEFSIGGNLLSLVKSDATTVISSDLPSIVSPDQKTKEDDIGVFNYLFANFEKDTNYDINELNELANAENINTETLSSKDWIIKSVNDVSSRVQNARLFPLITNVINYQETTSKLVDAKNLVLPDFSSKLMYAHMFAFTENLKSAPKLPSNNIASFAYLEMFKASGIEDISNIKFPTNTSINQGGCKGMFVNCNNLKTYSPDIFKNVSSVAPYGLSFMFSNTGLLSAPKLYCTSLVMGEYDTQNHRYDYGNHCKQMFSDCVQLQSLPNEMLPASSVPDLAYCDMFNSCINLENVPSDLFPNAINFSSGLSSFLQMFYNCSKLNFDSNNRLKINITNMGNTNSNFEKMFKNCTELVNGPILRIADNAWNDNEDSFSHYPRSTFNSMFENCDKLNSIVLDLEFPFEQNLASMAAYENDGLTIVNLFGKEVDHNIVFDGFLPKHDGDDDFTGNIYVVQSNFEDFYFPLSDPTTYPNSKMYFENTFHVDIENQDNAKWKFSFGYTQ